MNFLVHEACCENKPDGKRVKNTTVARIEATCRVGLNLPPFITRNNCQHICRYFWGSENCLSSRVSHTWRVALNRGLTVSLNSSSTRKDGSELKEVDKSSIEAF